MKKARRCELLHTQDKIVTGVDPVITGEFSEEQRELSRTERVGPSQLN